MVRMRTALISAGLLVAVRVAVASQTVTVAAGTYSENVTPKDSGSAGRADRVHGRVRRPGEGHWAESRIHDLVTA
jgi:hypothetical protein